MKAGKTLYHTVLVPKSVVHTLTVVLSSMITLVQELFGVKAGSETLLIRLSIHLVCGSRYGVACHMWQVASGAVFLQ